MRVFDKLFGEKFRKKEGERGLRKSDKADKALVRAALYGHTKTVRALIDSGANVNARKVISGWTPLMAAASEGKTAVIRILLDKGADIDAQNPSGTTALTIAARNGHAETVLLLLEKGADVNHRSPDGVSALSAAAAFGKTHIVKLLLSQGAKDDSRALQTATQLGHVEIKNLLEECQKERQPESAIHKE